MKKNIKKEAETKNVPLDILDRIDDSYLSEALALHCDMVDTPRRARSPKLFMKRLSAVAACLLIIAALVPLTFILSTIFDGKMGGSDFEAESPEAFPPGEDIYNDIMSGGIISDCTLLAVLSPGESTETSLGRLGLVSFSEGVFTLELSAPTEDMPRILLVAEVGGEACYSLNFDGEYEGLIIENGFTAELTASGNGCCLTVDAAAFLDASGASPDALCMVIYLGGDAVGILPTVN